MQQRDTAVSRRIREREAGLRRLRHTTVAVLGGATALAIAFGGLAAKALPGRSHTARNAAAAKGAGPPPGAAQVRSRPPALVPAAAPASQAPPAPQPAPAPPVTTQAPPVAVSGGS
jgi:hypothetical protein